MQCGTVPVPKFQGFPEAPPLRFPLLKLNPLASPPWSVPPGAVPDCVVGGPFGSRAICTDATAFFGPVFEFAGCWSGVGLLSPNMRSRAA